MNQILTQATHQQIHKKNIFNPPHKKFKKSVFALSILSAALLAASVPASAQYVEAGQLGNKASWESTEYQADWGLSAMKASSAYALGFYGQGVKVGVMDSGALLFLHPDLNNERFHAVAASGQYGSSGIRFPQDATGGEYTAGQEFDVTGQWIQGVNDGHGTHVTGTVGANRDGTGMHGVAWGADVYVGNTGATDGNNYGPYQDYQFFYTGWKAMVDSGVQVINNSWGTNIRIINQGAGPGPDGGVTNVHLPADTLAQTEYEYYYFKKMYGDAPSFVDAAYDAVKGTNTVQVFTTGNRDFANPFYRGLYPYFNPEAEKHWITVGGLKQDGSLEGLFNEAGNAKWWTVVAPGRVINSTTVNASTGAPGYGNSSGTSMSAPHVTGAMGVLLSRYPNMTALQVRDVMFTTATNKKPDGSTMLDLWTAPDGVPDVRYGWGIPDLEKGMYGPGQFLGHFEYSMNNTPLDVWTNDISQTALIAREQEDLAWLQDYQANGIAAAGGYELGNSFIVNDRNSDNTDHIIDQADAEKWRAEYFAKRAAAIQAKIDAGLYVGSLVKLGSGALIMTGANTYSGGTTVKEGSLFGFTESFGTGNVAVNGGRFGILSSYNDTFTQKGNLTSTESQKANIEVNNGGTYVVVTNENVNVGTLTFKEGSKITVDSIDAVTLLDAYRNNISLTGTVTATTLTDFDKATGLPDYAFFKASLTTSGSTITGSLSRNNDVTFSSYATRNNDRAIAGAIDLNRSGALYEALIPATIGQVRASYDSLSNDMYLNANNASIMNAMLTSRTLREQAMGIGNGRTAVIGSIDNDGETSSGRGGAGNTSSTSQTESGNARIWITGIGNWSNLDYGQSDMDVDFYAALVGAEVNVTANNKVGLFFGAGSTKYKGGAYGKIDSNDLHFGLYGIYNAMNTASITYGLTYTNQNRDAQRTLVVGNQTGINPVSNDAQITQLFAEAAYTGWKTDTYTVEPYFGLNWMRINSDGFHEIAGNMLFSTSDSKQTLQVATLGVRGSIPFKLGTLNMAAKGDISGMHFFGDTTPEAYMYLANSGIARLEGGELDNLLGVSLGVEAQITNSSKLELSYQGAFNGDIKSHGVYAKLRINF